MSCCRRVPLPRGDILPGCDNLPPPRCVRWAAAVRLYMIITIYLVTLRSVQTPAAAPCCSTCHVAGMWRWRVEWTTCSLSHVSRWPGSPSRGTSQGDLFLYKVTSRLNSEITLILTAWHMTSSPANTQYPYSHMVTFCIFFRSPAPEAVSKMTVRRGPLYSVSVETIIAEEELGSPTAILCTMLLTGACSRSRCFNS